MCVLNEHRFRDTDIFIISMAYLALDTETTGLPSKRTKDFKNLVVFDSCRIVSVACVLYNSNNEEICNFHEIIKPDGYKVTATEIHGITHDQAVKDGKDFSEVWRKLQALFLENPTVVGHNLDFDMTMLKSEAFRRGFNTDCFTNTNEICTQKMAKDIYKKPFRLGALYLMLTGGDLEGWHGALADSRAAAKVYSIMINRVKPTTKNIGVNKIIIKASEVAACIGKNPYKKPYEISDEIWKKYCPETFTGITKTDQAKTYLSKSKEAQDALTSAIASKTEKSDDTQTIIKSAEERINSDTSLTMSEKREVNSYIRSKINTNFGTRSEDKTSAKVEAAEGVVLMKDDNFYSIDITIINGTRYVITGKIDRIEAQSDGSRVLVEIKNRTRGLFNAVRVYEMIQVQTYLQMLKLDTARLIEQYNDETSSNIINRDQNYWDVDVMPKLVEFCNDIHAQMSN